MGKQVEELQNEIKLLKNEIKESLIDIREYLLTTPQNPFPVDPETGESRRSRTSPEGPANTASQPPPLTVSQPVIMGAPQQPIVQPPPPMMPNYGMMGGMPNVMPGPGAMPTAVQGPTVVAPEVVNPNGNGQQPENTPKDSQPQEPATDNKDQAPGPEVTPAKRHQPPGPRREQADAGNRPGGPRSPQPRARRPIPRPDEGATRAMNGKPLLTEYEEDVEYEYPDEDPEPETVSTRDEEYTKEAIRPTHHPPGPDPLTVVKLASWTEDAVRKVGRDRLMGILDLYEATGGLSAPMKDALLRLASLAPDPDARADASLSECMWVFLDLDNLMARTRASRSGLGHH